MNEDANKVAIAVMQLELSMDEMTLNKKRNALVRLKQQEELRRLDEADVALDRALAENKAKLAALRAPRGEEG
jgi:hypothetical protein